MFFGELPGKIVGFIIITVALFILGYFFNNVYMCGFLVGVVSTITYYSIFEEEEK